MEVSQPLGVIDQQQLTESINKTAADASSTAIKPRMAEKIALITNKPAHKCIHSWSLRFVDRAIDLAPAAQ
jgi:hypothetical protein